MNFNGYIGAAAGNIPREIAILLPTDPAALDALALALQARADLNRARWVVTEGLEGLDGIHKMIVELENRFPPGEEGKGYSVEDLEALLVRSLRTTREQLEFVLKRGHELHGHLKRASGAAG